MWAIGVILYYILRGRLPFSSLDTDEIIRLTLEGLLDFSGKEWAGISDEAIDLITQLLQVI